MPDWLRFKFGHKIQFFAAVGFLLFVVRILPVNEALHRNIIGVEVLSLLAGRGINTPFSSPVVANGDLFRAYRIDSLNAAEVDRLQGLLSDDNRNCSPVSYFALRLAVANDHLRTICFEQGRNAEDPPREELRQFWTGILLYESDEIDRAIEQWAHFWGTARYFHELAAVHYWNADFGGAVTADEVARQLMPAWNIPPQPSSAMYHARFASALIREKEYERALEQSNEALRLAGQDDEIAISLAREWLASGSAATAEVVLNRYASRATLTVRGHLLLATIMEDQGKYEQARESLETLPAEATQSERAEARRKLGDLSARIGDFVSAESHYNAAVALNDSDMRNFFALARFYEQMGALEQAAKTFESGGHAAQTDEDHAWVLFEYGRFLERIGEIHQAVELFLQSISLDGGEPGYFFALTQIYIRTDRIDDALQILDRAHSQFPDDKRFVELETQLLSTMSADPEE